MTQTYRPNTVQSPTAQVWRLYRVWRAPKRRSQVMGRFSVASLPAVKRRRIVVDESGCWLWRGSVINSGYGKSSYTRADGTRIDTTAHRVMYELLVGEIPEEMDLDHLCRVRTCVNPEHVEPVSRREHNARTGTPDAVNAAKTHCPRGHELSTENTYRRPDGKGRECLFCRRKAAVEYARRVRGRAA